uniref:BrnA antitoxin of type II toxin-antitoxin system n=2 Tax=Candidatus Kentrum sp. FM TaxID=2126340 RepID=A0A450RXR0_9GAMM|nr:MAG: BrnA antitoxin of type II toxin-antitoxin system [Candidatus Kentron sp. FM]
MPFSHAFVPRKLRPGRILPQMENTPVSIRLSNEVVSYFRATGKGWQTRVDEVLEEWMAARHSV